MRFLGSSRQFTGAFEFGLVFFLMFREIALMCVVYNIKRAIKQ